MENRAELQRDIQDFRYRLVEVQHLEVKGSERVKNYRKRYIAALTVACVLLVGELYAFKQPNAKGYLLPIAAGTFLIASLVGYSIYNGNRGAAERRNLIILGNKREALELSLRAKEEQSFRSG